MDVLATHLQMKEWILAAGDLIRSELANGLTVEEKSGRKDLVTNLDKAVERFLIRCIKEVYPDHQIISEEGFEGTVTSLAGYTWFIDPIDGTLNFVQKKRDFAIMVALYKDGEPVLGYIYDVVHRDFVFSIAGYGAYQNDIRLDSVADKRLEEGILHMNGSMILAASDELKSVINRSLGTRTVGSAAHNHLAVIRGEALAYLSLLLAPWDIAAGMAIAKEVGVEFCDIQGNPINLLQTKNKVMITNKGVKNELLVAFQSLANLEKSFS